MAGRSAHVRLISATPTVSENNNESRSSTLVPDPASARGRNNTMRTPERRRSSSQGDATPRAPAHSLSHSPAPGESPQTQGDHPTKRLGFFGDILLSSAGSISISSSAQRSSPIPHSFLPARTHSRGESALARDNASSPTPNMAAAAGQPAKGHTSPSKASTTRTYDSKLVSREMHRLGTLAHLPSLALAPSLSATPSNIALASHMAPPSGAGPSAAAALAAESPWASLHVLILPLFNEEPLRVPIEDLNQLVRRHISTVVSAAPGKAVATLEHDTRDLISAGMVTLNSKLAGVSDENLVPRVVELWSSFWTQVLPYLEGALLPLQTDPILSSLYRLPKAQRPSSPTSAQNGKGIGGNVLLPSSASTQLGVRALALVSFRDRIVLPLFPRLNARLTLFKDEHPSSAEPHQPRLQQMLLVLVSQRSQRLVSLSLTAPPPQPTAGEAAITRLLRAMHAPLATLARGSQARPTTGAPSFLSAGLPRDRRGRIGARGSTATNATATGAELDARGRWRLREDVEEGEDEGTWGAGTVYADTPRGGVSFADPERERDKELLESLRSPDPEGGAGAGRAGMGGWGLGGEEDEYEYEYEDDDEIVEEPEENLDWDAAQSIVERMVGIKNDSLPPTPSAHQHQQPPPPPPHQQQPQQDPRRRMI